MKYRVLLVDDEALELDALKNYVDWDALGMELAGTAKNGKVAWEKILAEEPDVVITDIHMPVMDGITLANKIYDLNRKIKILFLTAYDDVDYLKAAIKVSVSDYIMKPFSDDTIRTAMEKVCAEIEKDRMMRQSLREGRSALIRKICTSEAEAEAEQAWIKKLAKLNEFERDSNYYGMMQIYGVPRKNFVPFLESRLLEIISVWQEDGKLAVVVKGYINIADSAKRILQSLEQLTEQVYNGVYFERRILPEELSKVYRILESYERRMFYDDAQKMRAVAELDVWCLQSQEAELSRELLDSIHKRLTEDIMAGDQKQIEDDVDQLLGSFYDKGISRKAALGYLDRLLYQVEWTCMIERNRKEMQQLAREAMEKAERCLNAQQLREVLTGYFQAIAAYNAADVPDTMKYVVQKVKEYICKNYAEPISTAALSEEIHLSQNYIRSIFKEGTGKTILEYLTEYRFEKAAELLRRQGVKVKEVSAAVGYENVPYFITLFTRIYGMTPGEYHKKYKN